MMSFDNWIQTFTGQHYHPLHPSAEDVRIEDIAHALSNQCRFAGHTKTFYSVAEHSLRVSEYVQSKGVTDPTVLLWALLHDAGEAYMIDLPSPIKHSSEFDVFRHYEHINMTAIMTAFNLPLDCPESGLIEDGDDRLFWTEERDLIDRGDVIGSRYYNPLDDKIVPLSPREAECRFLYRYYVLDEKREAAEVQQ